MAPIEEWVFAAWQDDATLGVVSGHRIVGRTAWYWAALAREGRPLLHITDFDVRSATPTRSSSRARRCGPSTPARRRWSSGRSATRPTRRRSTIPTTRSDGRTARRRRSRSTSSGMRPATPRDRRRRDDTRLRAAGVVHGRIEILGEPPVDVVEIPAHRWHRWAETADRPPEMAPLTLPEAIAHTGVRAPFAIPGRQRQRLGARPSWLARAPQRALTCDAVGAPALAVVSPRGSRRRVRRPG